MVCKKCNTPLADGATFCSNCGTPTASPSNFEEHTQSHNVYPNPYITIQPRKNNTLLFVLLGMTFIFLIGCIITFFLVINKSNKNMASDSAIVSTSEKIKSEQTSSENLGQAQANSQTAQQNQSQNPEQNQTDSENTQPFQIEKENTQQTNSDTQLIEENIDTDTSAQEMISLAYNNMEAPASDFVFPYSRERLLTEEDLRILEATEPDDNHDTVTDQEHSNSQMAINEILARYGYPFKSNASKKTGQEAYNKFSSLSWYQQIKPLCSYSSANDLIEDLTSIERQNIAIIDEWQKQHGCYY